MRIMEPGIRRRRVALPSMAAGRPPQGAMDIGSSTSLQKMKTLGYGISWLIAFAGLTVGGIVAYMSDEAVSALRHCLKIN